jgi:diacylglycerol O-acyltransferase
VFSQPLRRDRPLWEIWLVEGLVGGRFALLSKTHHALVDGVSGLDILSVLFAPEEQSLGEHEQWRARPAPSAAWLLGESLLERATVPAEGYRAMRAVLRRPRQLGSEALSMLRGASALVSAGLSPAPSTPFNEELVGPDRRFTWVRASLGDVKSIKNSLGGTVNDVVLAIVTGALRRYLQRRGVGVEGMTLKALVPVSVRGEEHRGALGNKVSGMIAPLPVSCADPAASLQTITAAMDHVKSSGQAIGAQALTELSGFAPANLISQAGRLAFRQRFINLVVTNIPGPQLPLMMSGREMLDIFPMVPLGSNLALGIAIVSYNGTLNFGLVGDFKIVHDLGDLAGDLTDALTELADAANVTMSTTRAAALDTPQVRLSPDGTAQTITDKAVPISEPWPGYDRLTIPQISKRLQGADPILLSVVAAYERLTKRRRGILQLTSGAPAPR